MSRLQLLLTHKKKQSLVYYFYFLLFKKKVEIYSFRKKKNFFKQSFKIQN